MSHPALDDSSMRSERVIAYLDWFNLYHGLMDAKMGSSRWLDLVAMSQSLLEPNQRLVLLRYFTTRIRNRPDKEERQSTYIDALEARGGLEIDYGFYLSKRGKCRRCGNKWPDYEEKKTDVNISVRLLNDAFDDHFDTALVISGDSDLVPAVESVKARHPAKRLIAAFPPRRFSNDLAQVAHADFAIGDDKIRGNRLPDPVRTAEGIELRAPAGWLPSNS